MSKSCAMKVKLVFDINCYNIILLTRVNIFKINYVTFIVIALLGT